MMIASRCYLSVLLVACAAQLTEGQTVTLPPPVPQCRLGPFKSCPLSAMRRDEPTLVYPGGNTRCMSVYQPDYSFIVLPGDSDKLLIYFEGGGICFDGFSHNFRLCPDQVGDTNVDGSALGPGIFNRHNGDVNPFRNYTAIVVKYCSGDLYVGNAKKDYGEVRGRHNAQATIDWAAKMIPHADKLVLAGQSAGGIALHLWSHALLGQLRYTHASVIIDSFVLGVWPLAAQKLLVDSFELCDSGLLRPEDKRECDAGELTVQKVFAGTMDEYPDVSFALVNSKTDQGQIFMYDIVASMVMKNAMSLSKEKYYTKILGSLELFNLRPNFVSYLLNSNVHGYFDKDYFDTATTSGLDGFYGADESESISLHKWISNFPITGDTIVKSECFGRTLLPAEWMRTGTRAFHFCDQHQARKVYGQPGFVISAVDSVVQDFIESQPKVKDFLGSQPQVVRPRVQSVVTPSQPGGSKHVGQSIALARWALPVIGIASSFAVMSLCIIIARSHPRPYASTLLNVDGSDGCDSDSEVESLSGDVTSRSLTSE